MDNVSLMLLFKILVMITVRVQVISIRDRFTVGLR